MNCITFIEVVHGAAADLLYNIIKYRDMSRTMPDVRNAIGACDCQLTLPWHLDAAGGAECLQAGTRNINS